MKLEFTKNSLRAGSSFFVHNLDTKPLGLIDGDCFIGMGTMTSAEVIAIGNFMRELITKGEANGS